MSLILLRHAEPAGGAGRCYGRSELDVGANFAADAVAIEVSLPAVATIVTSPAKRCRALADFIGTARGLPIAEDARLVELDFGAWEARPWDTIPRRQIDAWAADVLHARPHGGESVAMLMARVEMALADWRKVPGPFCW